MEKKFSYPKSINLALTIICIGLATILSSCLKAPKPIPVGEAKLRYINAAFGSAAQAFYINGKRFGSGLVNYGQMSASFPVVSGTQSLAFADEASSQPTAGINGELEINGNYSIFLYKNLDGKAEVLGIGDNLTAPDAGKAKIRFIHLNGFLNNSIAIKVTGGAELISALPFANSSTYYQVDPGAKFIASGTGVTSNPEIDLGILAGKIYTVWLSGSDSTELKAYSFTAN
ncbi:protein of unknown function [Pedobacter steynii]|uniref:DUF4397 domain-containing protein n=1 Tax=Pedobacter steynii TaxID=430522 RepID=A0A1G9YUS2_9SPHI|nr:DUF4397 domain-containing protein [Pedobacter steynii]NQX39820.1 DUF4397 domain-containing protein [Pedobacter steynii]SDN12116.1 protein of unknown function [Pedobacter steynii]